MWVVCKTEIEDSADIKIISGNVILKDIRLNSSIALSGISHFGNYVRVGLENGENHFYSSDE